MRDRLRHAAMSEEFQNHIGGSGSRTVGQGYGSWYRLEQLGSSLRKLRRRGDFSLVVAALFSMFVYESLLDDK